MLAGELAALAGITPRTLRHYRDIGLLGNVPQGENGYFNYTLDHLIRLLRIKNLAALGFSLDQVRELLANRATERERLDALDQALAEQIAHLETQRQTIARLKQAHLAADTPLAFAELFVQLAKTELPSDFLAHEENGLRIMEHLLSADDREQAASFFNRLLSSERWDDALTLERRLAALSANPDHDETEALAEDYAALLRELLGDSTVDAAALHTLTAALAPLSEEKVSDLYMKMTTRILEKILAE